MATSWNAIASPAGGIVFLGLKWETLDSIERRLPPYPEDEIPEERTLFWQLRTLEDETLDLRNA